jgi:hypothetical protein
VFSGLAWLSNDSFWKIAALPAPLVALSATNSPRRMRPKTSGSIATCAGALAFFLLLATQNAFGQSTSSNLPTNPLSDSLPSSPTEIAQLSGQMAELGRKNSDPILLISAARLRAGLGLIAYDAGLGSSEKWLDEASSLAPNDPFVDLSAQKARELLVRGRRPGPLVWQKRLQPTISEQIVIQFQPGFRATVYAEASSPKSLVLKIKNDDGSEICVDEAAQARSICSWVAEGSGTYTASIAVKRTSDILVITN